MEKCKLYSSKHTGDIETTTSQSYTAISNFEPISIDLSSNASILITLTVPDTWNEDCGTWNWFAIDVDGAVIASGLTTVTARNARVPITVSGVVVVAAGKHVVTPKWMVMPAPGCTNAGTAHIGNTGTCLLTALPFQT